MIDTQSGFNAVVGLIAFLGAWVLNRLSTDIKALQAADTDLTRSVQHIELLVAGSYVKREDLDRLTLALFAKLDKIETKLDTKADR